MYPRLSRIPTFDLGCTYSLAPGMRENPPIVIDAARHTSRLILPHERDTTIALSIAL